VVDMKAIGGYFELEQLVEHPFYTNMMKLNTGRNALLYLIKTKGIKKLHLPYYMCSSVSEMLFRYEIEVDYYHIDVRFNPIFNKNLDEDEYLYVVNYYGQLTNDIIRTLQNRYKRIIVDNTQAFFQEPVDGIDTIYSCRKFFGIPDGAYLSTDKKLEVHLQTDVSKDRMGQILGRFEDQASKYYIEYKENEALFKELPLMKMSSLTQNILGAIDYSKVYKTRNENYRFLASTLGPKNALSLISPVGAFAYPMYMENGLAIRKELAQKKIYIPTLWPNVLEECDEGSIEYDYAMNILPLPCDQRYSLLEMEHLANQLIVIVK